MTTVEAKTAARKILEPCASELSSETYSFLVDDIADALSAALPGKDVEMAIVESALDSARKVYAEAYRKAKDGWAAEALIASLPDPLRLAIEAYLAALVSQPQPEGEAVDCCPICLVPFKPGDLCSTDIELGTCHAGCLEGSPTVNLETGEPTDGPIPTFHYAELVHPDPTIQGAGLIEALPPERHEAETRQIGDDAGPTSGAFDAGWNEYRRKALKILAARGVRP